MKKLLMVLGISLILPLSVLAGENENNGNHYAYGHYKFHKVGHKTINIYNTTNVTEENTTQENITNVAEISDTTVKNIYGAKLDAPNLVHLYGDWFLGAEGGKDLNQTNVNEGWFVYGKVTYKGTWFDFDKKNEQTSR